MQGGGQCRRKGNPVTRRFTLIPRRGVDGKLRQKRFVLGQKLGKIFHQDVSLRIFSWSCSESEVGLSKRRHKADFINTLYHRTFYFYY